MRWDVGLRVVGVLKYPLKVSKSVQMCKLVLTCVNLIPKIRALIAFYFGVKNTL